MKNLRKIGTMLLTTAVLFATGAKAESTVAELNNCKTDSLVRFTGELTIQGGDNINIFAYDAAGDYVRLQSYAYYELDQKKFPTGLPEKNSKIKFGTTPIRYMNDTNNCRTLYLDSANVKEMTLTGSVEKTNEAQETLISDIKADKTKKYNAEYVCIKGVKVETITDFVNSIFETRLISGKDTIDMETNLVGIQYPSMADIRGFVSYTEGKTVIYCPGTDYIKPTKFDNIASLKKYTNPEGYEFPLEMRVLVNSAEKTGGKNIYRVQKNDAAGNASALKVEIPETMKLNFVAGDSIELKVKGHYTSSELTTPAKGEKQFSSAAIEVKEDLGTKKISDSNRISFIQLNSAIADELWPVYDNCVVTLHKSRVISNEQYSKIGCIGLEIKNLVTDKKEIMLVADKYYKQLGTKPKEITVRGIVGGYENNGTEYAAIIPTSTKDFMQDTVAFKSIADMIKGGTTPANTMTYRLENPVKVTGLSRLKTPFGITQVVFIQDASGAMELNYFSKRKMEKIKVGDVVKGIEGYFDEGGLFSPLIDVDTSKIETTDIKMDIQPEEIETLADLDYTKASKLITIKNLKKTGEEYKENLELFYIVTDGKDEIAVPTVYFDKTYEYPEEITSLTGNYFRIGEKSQIVAQSQESIKGKEDATRIEKTETDRAIYVSDAILYAENAEIEVYDITGIKIAEGRSMVDLNKANSNIFVVKTTYENGETYITKVAK